MMKPLDESVVEQRQAELKEELLPASGVAVANAEALSILSTVRRFEFPQGSGRLYEVKRVPYYEGTIIYDIYLRIREVDQHPDWAKSGIFDKMLDEVIDLAWKKLVKPVGLVGKVRKLFTLRNPFKKMSDAEVAELLCFFLARRKTSSVRFLFPAQEQASKSQ